MCIGCEYIDVLAKIWSSYVAINKFSEISCRTQTNTEISLHCLWVAALGNSWISAGRFHSHDVRHSLYSRSEKRSIYRWFCASLSAVIKEPSPQHLLWTAYEIIIFAKKYNPVKLSKLISRQELTAKSVQMVSVIQKIRNMNVLR